LKKLATMLGAMALMASATAVAQTTAAPADISAYKDKLRVVTDGKGHYVAMVPFTTGDDDGMAFYGDGKEFHALRRSGGGRSGNESFDFIYWEPRYAAVERWRAGFGLKERQYKVQCDDRQTVMFPLPKAEQQKILGEAKFFQARWQRRAYKLARDDNGAYYFVDQAREPEENNDFRVWVGPKGKMKPVKMVNIVKDTKGEIFITKDGSLKLISGSDKIAWTQGKKEVPLTRLDFDEDARNIPLVYKELGVYAGERLGTPCDDL
jgi:hypothetical protein